MTIQIDTESYMKLTGSHEIIFFNYTQIWIQFWANIQNFKLKHKIKEITSEKVFKKSFQKIEKLTKT